MHKSRFQINNSGSNGTIFYSVSMNTLICMKTGTGQDDVEGVTLEDISMRLDFGDRRPVTMP